MKQVLKGKEERRSQYRLTIMYQVAQTGTASIVHCNRDHKVLLLNDGGVIDDMNRKGTKGGSTRKVGERDLRREGHLCKSGTHTIIVVLKGSGRHDGHHD